MDKRKLLVAVALLVTVTAMPTTNATRSIDGLQVGAPLKTCTTDADCPGSYCMNDPSHKPPYSCHGTNPPPAPGPVLYRCYDHVSGDHMVSKYSNCEDPSSYRTEGSYGHTSGTPVDSIELFRCNVHGGATHSVRLAGEDCPSGSDTEFSLGYLYKYPPGGPNATQLFQCASGASGHSGYWVCTNPKCEGNGKLVQALGWTLSGDRVC